MVLSDKREKEGSQEILGSKTKYNALWKCEVKVICREKRKDRSKSRIFHDDSETLC